MLRKIDFYTTTTFIMEYLFILIESVVIMGLNGTGPELSACLKKQTYMILDSKKRGNLRTLY